jgi:hypothetical protein
MECRCRDGDLGLWLKFSYLVVDLSPGAQLAEALDVGMNKVDWLVSRLGLCPDTSSGNSSHVQHLAPIRCRARKC